MSDLSKARLLISIVAALVIVYVLFGIGCASYSLPLTEQNYADIITTTLNVNNLSFVEHGPWFKVTVPLLPDKSITETVFISKAPVVIEGIFFVEITSVGWIWKNGVLPAHVAYWLLRDATVCKIGGWQAFMVGDHVAVEFKISVPVENIDDHLFLYLRAAGSKAFRFKILMGLWFPEEEDQQDNDSNNDQKYEA